MFLKLEKNSKNFNKIEEHEMQSSSSKFIIYKNPNILTKYLKSFPK